MRSQVTASVAGFFQANHFGAISALLFSMILSACSGGYDSPISNDYSSPSLLEVTVRDADAPLRDDVILGGTFVINITADEAILAPTVMINGLAADSIVGSGTSWQASRVMVESDTAGEITFTITFTDLNTNPGVLVSASTDGRTVNYCAEGCGTNGGGGNTDGGTTDGGTTDGGTTDGGATDGGTTDGGTTDGGTTDGGTTDGGTPATAGIEMVEGFGGAEVTGTTFNVPAGSEAWAGFANLNTDVYPFTFANGGSITFTAAVASGGADTNVYFRFERLPHPDVDPSFNLDSVLISGETEMEYTVIIPAQDAANTYESFLMYVVEIDSAVMIKDIVVTDDGGSTGDGTGATDGGTTDGGTADGGTTDGGTTDGGTVTSGIEMIEGFGGAEFANDTFNVPAGSEDWAGFANLNTDVYPFTFANGGSITFTAAVASGGADTNVYFRFERLPHPDVDPSFNLDPVVITGEAELEYTVIIPAQDAANTYESFLLYVVERDSAVIIKDIVVTDDGGSTGDGTGATDGGTTDGGTTDGGTTDGGTTDGGATGAVGIEMIEGFGGALFAEDTFTNPTGAEAWAGFANLNFDVYPFTFANGGSITFTAAVAAGGSDTNVYFRFERLPHPDVEPSFNLDSVLIVGETELEYTIAIPAQDAANTYESFLMYVVELDSTVIIKNIVVTDDIGSTDEPRNVGSTDGGTTDGGTTDGGTTDGGATDGGTIDTVGIEMVEGFGGAGVADNTFNVPTGSEDWAGFANLNTDVYPFTFANGGSITFTAAVAAGASDTNVYFRFERLPHPDVDPSFNLDPVLIVGQTEQEYTLTIPPQDAANTYESFLLYVVERDSAVTVKHIVVTDDSGSTVSDKVEVAPYEEPTGPAVDVVKNGQVADIWGGNASISFNNGDSSTAVVADAERGDVLEVTHPDVAGVQVMQITTGDVNPVDADAFIELSFDIKVTEYATSEGFGLKLIVQSSGGTSGAPLTIDLEPTNNWQNVVVQSQVLKDRGVDMGSLTGFVVFPAGTVYQIDDFRLQGAP